MLRGAPRRGEPRRHHEGVWGLRAGPPANFPCFPSLLINTRLTPPWGSGKVTGWALRFYSGKGSLGLPGVSLPELPRVLTPLAAPPTLLCLAVSSGSVTVNGDSTVQVLAEEAVTMDMLDLATAKSNLEKAISEVAAAALLGAVPGPLDGSRARRCLRERAAALRSRAGPRRCLRVPAGPGSPGPAVRAAWGPAGSAAASAPGTLPSTANKQLLSQGRRGEAAYLVAHFSLRPAKSLPHLFPSHVLAVGRLSAPQRCAWQESHCRCRETPDRPTCSGFPVCTDGAGQMEAEKPL
ncbi:ATP synthase subunit delta, mitochondrial [Aix galericulata]|nr:ATP synthase subunit delta, mitochondrial [Aix galericulata]